jgi:uncharacterized protein YkwD
VRSSYRAVCIAAVLACGAQLSIASAPPAGAATGTCYTYLSTEKGFARATNKARAAAGLPKLRLDPQLSWVAKYHTKAMARKNSLYHATNYQLSHRITRWRVIGENIGEDQGGTVGALQAAFMASPEHKANILDSSYKFVGVGVVIKKGMMWVTLDFEGAKNPGTRLTMPGC